MSQLLPPSVEHVVGRYLDLLDAEGGPILRGLYLVGSVALDDYRPGASDIDFVAIVEREITNEDCDALARSHDALAGEGGPHFDGFYLEAAELRRPPADYAAVPFSLEGRFRAGEVCREVNPVVWRCLARSGRTIRGPSPAELGVADADVLIRAYQIENLQSYWLQWIDQAETALAAKRPGEDCNAEALAWGVLGVSRIACGLETGQVVSKKAGGHHALASRPACWHAVIHEALWAHAGTLKRCPVEALREGLAYMRFAIDESTNRPAAA